MTSPVPRREVVVERSGGSVERLPHRVKAT